MLIGGYKRLDKALSTEQKDSESENISWGKINVSSGTLPPVYIAKIYKVKKWNPDKK